MGFWDFIWLLIWSFCFVYFLMILFHILGDLFRDHDLSGWAKALWVIGLIVLPFLMSLIYLITRGRGMAERQAESISAAQAAMDRHIQDVAASTSNDSATQIASAKALLDNGTIDQAEFDRLKQKALA